METSTSVDFSIPAPLAGLLQCPRCSAPLESLACPSCACQFPTISGQPILIDFQESIFDRGDYAQEYSARTAGRESLAARITRRLTPTYESPARCAELLAREVLKLSPSPRILIIGGGTRNPTLEALYAAPGVEIICSDVYASPHTLLVADGHRLPFRDGVFDGVVIQAVLEHVLDPKVVVAEIVRVLRRGGVVYAETPFMQQVHEGAYDFTRFTCSGHRWLFRDFSELSAGVALGAGSAALWSARALLRSLGMPHKFITIACWLLSPLQWADRTGRRREHADAACGVYFVGAKSDQRLSPKDMVAYYAAQARQRGEPSGAPGELEPYAPPTPR